MDLVNVLAHENVCTTTFNAPTGIPGDLAYIVHMIYLGIKIVVPILLVIFGSIEMAKAITAQKEDEIKKAQGSFVKKLIIAVIIFLALSIVEFVTDFAGGKDNNAWTCTCELLKGSGKCS